MTSRIAGAAIKGYYYQFDTSILKLLDLRSNEDSITIEGIEDIDVNTSNEDSTIQCKYLSKPKFTNSAVRNPITLMLDHFVNPSTQGNYNYVLYAHFANETPNNEPIIDLTKLKTILTYSENKIEKHYEIEKGISDATLNAFLLQFKFTFGVEFYTQQKQVIDKLKNKFNCSEFEADTLYYNNALRIIIDKAIQKNVTKRIITKIDFISGIDCSKMLFNEWFIKLRSKKEYLKLISQNLKSTRTLEPPRTKIIFLGRSVLEANNSELPLLIFIESLIKNYYKLNSSLRDARPLTIILDCNKSERLEIKRSLIDNQIHFNDGCEEIKFSSDFFNRDAIINKTTNGAKIIKSSFLLKLISKKTFEINFSAINSPSSFLIFSKEDFPKKFPSGQLFDVKYCDNLFEVHMLLTP